MPELPPKGAKRRYAFAAVAGIVATCAIALLALNVSKEVLLLSSASSDNVQWSLVQTQVEFLEFAQQLEKEPVNLALIREEFDIFYSRVTTVNNATVFESLRANPVPRAHLEDLLAFLEQTVPVIDAPDADLIRQLPELAVKTAEIRPTVRALGNSALDLFAQESDGQRIAVARTMTQLSFAVAALIGFLTLAVVYLNLLNTRIYRRERQLRQSAARMQTVMSASLDGVIVCNANGEILEFSPSAERIFGHVEADILGQEIGSVIVPDHMRNAHDAGMERMRVKGEKRVVGKGRVKLEAKHRDGHIFPVELAIQSAMTDEGEVFIAFLRDITHHVAAEAEILSARDKAMAGEKMKTEFLSIMSHEIRTPLNGLLGNMSLLRDTKLDPAQDRYLGHMETSGRLLMSHISDVLDITRYDAGKLNTRSEPVNISELLQDIVDNQSSTASRNETSLVWNWKGPRMDWILSDQERLQHVMMNLIGNAVKFTRRGTVKVTIENVGHADAAELLIKIADTGPGMTSDLTDRVFDDFVTGNTAYDRDVGGTGLGLSIAKRFVTALGGTIGVESAVGEGSTFWVSLPVSEARAAETTQTAAIVHPRGRPLSVLLVEDNEINRVVAREMLKAEGHTVVEAHDGSEGTQIANQRMFDLILMDISMPVMDGRTATRMIRAGKGASADSVIVALTANAMVEEQEEFIKDGMNGVLTKPMSRDALRSLLRQTEVDQEGGSLALINRDHNTETREALGEETYLKLRLRFAGEVDEFHAWLGSNEALDLLEIGTRAHKVAGSAAVFGADHLRQTLKNLEESAKVGHRDTIDEHIKAFGRAWRQTKPELSSSQ